MPSYAPPKPVTTHRRNKFDHIPNPTSEHWIARLEYLTDALASLRYHRTDKTWVDRIHRAEEHLKLLSPTSSNKEFARIFTIVSTEILHAFRASRPR